MPVQGDEEAKARGQTGLANFHQLRSIIARGMPKEQPHPVYGKPARDEGRDGAWREASRRLLDEPELRYGIMTDDWLQAFFTQIPKAQISRLVFTTRLLFGES